MPPIEERVLRSIARNCRSPYSEQDVADALWRVQRRHPNEGVIERFRRAATLLGLSVQDRRARVEALAEASGFDRWIVVPVVDSEFPVALRRHDDEHIEIHEFVESQDLEPRIVHQERLAEELKLDPTTVMSVIVAEALQDKKSKPALGETGRRPLARLWDLLTPDRTQIWIILGFSAANGVLALATPVAVQSLVNFVAFGGLVQPLVLVGVLLLAFLALAGVIRAFKTYVVEILQRRILIRVTSDLTYRLPRVRRDARDAGFGPELVNRFFDVITIQKTASILLLDGIGLVLHTAVGLLVLAFYHPLLLVFDAVLILAMTFVLFVLGRGAVRSAIKESKAKHDIAAALQEVARAPLTYKLAGASEYVNRRMDTLARGYVEQRRAHFRVVFRQVIGSVALHAVAGTALLTLGGWLVIAGQLTLGQLVAAELIVSLVLASFAKFGKQLEIYYDLLAATDKVGQLYDLPLETRGQEQRLEQDCAAKLDVRQVEYAYPSGVQAIDNFSMEVASGERVAVYGPHGSSKSTLAELICGLRAPDRGAVRIDETEVLDLSYESLRDHVALVAESELIQGSILENVRLGRRWVSTSDVRDSLAALEILDEVQRLPGGLDADVSPNGGPLSHGHSQLLMFARALAGTPRLLVIDALLDELDDDGLERTLHAIEAQGDAMSVIVFTTRRDIAKHFDRVVQIDAPDGRTRGAKVSALSEPGRLPRRAVGWGMMGNAAISPLRKDLEDPS